MMLQPLQGDYFKLIVTRRPDERHHRIHIYPKNVDTRSDLAIGIHCDDEKSRRELLRLVKAAEALAAHLDAGGCVECWPL